MKRKQKERKLLNRADTKNDEKWSKLSSPTKIVNTL